MSNKRKREEEDIESTPLSKASKAANEEVTRSGRVRKKPARFKDSKMDSDEDEAEALDSSKTTPAKGPPVTTKVSPKMVVTIPVPVTKVSPVPVAKVLTSPTPEVSAKPVMKSPPQTTKTLLQAKLLEAPKIVPVTLPPLPPPSIGSPAALPKVLPVTINPQAVQLSTLLVKTAAQAKPAVDVPQSPESSDATPKAGRVRKKSAKVLEMEAFEEAERAKHNVKKTGGKAVTSPTTTPPKVTKLKPEDIQQKIVIQKTLPVAGVTGVTSPVKAEPMEQMLNTVTVQQAILQLPVMKTDSSPAKNPLETIRQTASAKKPKKKKADVAPVSDISPVSQVPITPKVTRIVTKSGEVTITGLRSDVDPMLSTSFVPDSSTHLMVKEEPGEGVDLGLLSSEMHGINMSKVQKQNVVKPEPVTPAKKTKSKAKKAVLTDPEVGQTILQVSPDSAVPDEATKKASSVIKMLLSKPSQYTGPSVSTKAITTDKKSKQQKVPLDAELTVQTNVKDEPSSLSQGINNQSELKSKLLMSPTEMDDDDDEDDDDDLPYDSDEMYAEEDMLPESTGKKKVKKVKKKPKPKLDMEDDSIDGSVDWEFETADGNLVIAENISKAKAKKASPKKSKATTAGAEGYMDETQVGYASTNKKAKKSSPPATAEKKKKRLTAYTMWCNTVRNKVLNDNPGIDFAQLSRRLGEIWQGLPSKDKMNWKRKAKREARKLLGKGLLITTGKGGGGGGPAAASQAHNKVSSTAPSTVHHTLSQQHHSTVSKALTFTKPDDSTLASTNKSVLGSEPVDVAAHLKLLGESLSIIGMRLQEHRGLIAVQGSLSVLLDSMLCAVGPLMCLTSQVSEMNGCSSETHTRILDHIAYIMPGL